ncbi:efflux RND transporter periplasmic adaptor subunit [Clostridium aminobutyricum]|uniref:Efflux RND transporter periplasmic adaptor subunit n=1 Tax=Clostridium aminobutyricum TaxID=33953 RepID=A0A939D6A7_CLOAM|nr:efflux RND transporter periplasmic adaptor subunit [Clostridium aminobutyricum]MBN7772007.1 efflux RND transporter periplasmic adaptor subunit [Clostridium aminobutyricum]
MNNTNESQTPEIQETILDSSEEGTPDSPVPQSKKKKKKLITIVAVLLILGLVIFRIVTSMSTGSTEEESLVNVKIAKAEIMSIYTSSPITGRIEPIKEVDIIPMTSGKITSVNVSIGDKVSAGTVLFQIDGTQIATTYNQAKESYNVAKSAFDRVSVLYNQGAASLQDYEQAKMSYVSAQESLTAAGDAYSHCTVTSPINGYVTAVDVSVGNIASQVTAAMTVADVSQLQISSSVSEYIVTELEVGDSVDIYIQTLGEEPYKGSITAISPAPASGSLTYPIKISVDNSSGKIHAGMFAEIKIVSTQKENTLCVPSDCVILKAGKSIVVTLDKNELPVFNEVTTGIDNGKYVEITSGLKDGDTIVISGQQYVTEGTPVIVLEDK